MNENTYEIWIWDARTGERKEPTLGGSLHPLSELLIYQGLEASNVHLLANTAFGHCLDWDLSVLPPTKEAYPSISGAVMSMARSPSGDAVATADGFGLMLNMPQTGADRVSPDRAS